MSNYTAVQFISWEIYTGLACDGYAGLKHKDSPIDLQVDLINQCLDIDARVAFTAAAVNVAAAAKNEKGGALIDAADSTLKIFLAPEFLYRSAAGAYLHDLIDGWGATVPDELMGRLSGSGYGANWGGLVGGLTALAKAPQYKDWLFVFGSAIAAYCDADDTQSVLEAMERAYVYNIALIQRGGDAYPGNRYVLRKHYKSPVDFVKYLDCVLHQNVRAGDSRNAIAADTLGYLEGGAIFNIKDINGSDGKPIKFGIEICLDHAACTGVDPLTGKQVGKDFGRIRKAGEYVNIQLVPSSGMSLKAASIRLKSISGSPSHAYAINCDGLGAFTGYRGSHTQLWNGEVNREDYRLLETSGGEDMSRAVPVARVASTVIKVPDEIVEKNLDSRELWNDGSEVYGAGWVRVIETLAL
jgi:hypothetical protein